MASGFMNMISYWLFFISSVIMIFTHLFGPASSGDYLSAIVGIATGYFWSGMGMTLWLILWLYFIASFFKFLNYIVTVINLRTKGMSMTRLP
jgi:cytochrome c oxidase subunit 1